MTEIRRNNCVLVTWVHGGGTFITVPWGVSAHSLLHGHRSPCKSWEAQNVHSFPTEDTYGASSDQHHPLCPSGSCFHGCEAHWLEHSVQLSAALMVLFLLALMDTLPRWDVIFALPWIHLRWFGIKARSRTVLSSAGPCSENTTNIHKCINIVPPACLFLGCQSQRGRQDLVWKTTPFNHPILHFWRFQRCCSPSVTDLFSWGYRKVVVFRIQGPFCFPAK